MLYGKTSLSYAGYSLAWNLQGKNFAMLFHLISQIFQNEKNGYDTKYSILQYTKSSGVYCQKKMAMKQIISVQGYIKPNSGTPLDDKFK